MLHEADCSSFALNEERMQLVKNAMDRLPEQYRSVLFLQYFEDMSYDEISDVLQIPPGTVATRIRRTKLRLHTLLEPLGTDA